MRPVPAPLLALALLVAGCATPPEPECERTVGEGELTLECPPSPDATWADEALDEAREGFEERQPGSRP